MRTQQREQELGLHAEIFEALKSSERRTQREIGKHNPQLCKIRNLSSSHTPPWSKPPKKPQVLQLTNTAVFRN